MPELIVVKGFKRQNDGNGDKSKCYQLNHQDPNWLKTYKYAKKGQKEDWAPNADIRMRISRLNDTRWHSC